MNENVENVFLLLCILLCASFLLVLGNFLSPVGKGDNSWRVAEESFIVALSNFYKQCMCLLGLLKVI